MNIPQDPFMLLSFVNMKLRDDDFSSPEELCSSLDIECEKLVDQLKQAGFEYDPASNSFR